MQDFLSAAAQFINTTASHIFLTGKAGTGKTTFLRNLNEITHKSHIVVAPTGIAALNAAGVTIHSQFLLPPFTFLPDRFLPEEENSRFITQNTLAHKHPLNSARKQVLRSIDLLVIDEVSMLRADLLDAIDYRMRAARGNFKQSFGGAQVLFIGDLYQLPPVVRKEEWSRLNQYYHTPWFYEAKALKDEPLVYIELDKIFRQHDDTFISVLNNLRNNQPTENDINLLNQHYKTSEELTVIKEVITLTTHNFKADEINQQEINHLKSTSHFFSAHLEGEFPESMYPVAATIELKEGAQIMFVRNDNENKMYFNGKLATIKQISGETILVEMAETHQRYQLKRVRWENKKYVVEDANNLQEKVIGSFEQFPIKLAWAITVHKSQGLTFDKAIIDVGHAFADGQVYVALSRLRSLDGLILRAPISTSVISTDQQVVAFVKSNHRPDELPAVMKERQQEFIRKLFEKTFDFASLIKDIRYIRKDQIEGAIKENSMKPILVQLAESLEQEQVNTEKFRRQLTERLLMGDIPAFMERLTKGSAYYKMQLVQHSKILLHHLEVTKLQKRMKTYLTSITELDQALSKKLEEVDKAVYLTEAIFRGDEKIEMKSLTQQRAHERNSILSEIRKQLEVDPKAEKNKMPKKVRKPKKADTKNTFDVTVDLLNTGLTPEQIAQERSLTLGTIETHLAKAVTEDRISIFTFMQESAVMGIIDAYRQLPEGASSKDLYDKLKGKFGYGQLRAAMAHAKKKDN